MEKKNTNKKMMMKVRKILKNEGRKYPWGPNLRECQDKSTSLTVPEMGSTRTTMEEGLEGDHGHVELQRCS